MITDGLQYTSTIDISATTCKDDVTLISPDLIWLQSLIRIAEHDSYMDRYESSGAKTK